MASKRKQITLKTSNAKWTVSQNQVTCETIQLLCDRKPLYLKIEFSNEIVFPTSDRIFPEHLLQTGAVYLICFGMYFYSLLLFDTLTEETPSKDQIDIPRAQAASTLTSHIFKSYRYCVCSYLFITVNSEKSFLATTLGSPRPQSNGVPDTTHRAFLTSTNSPVSMSKNTILNLDSVKV